MTNFIKTLSASRMIQYYSVGQSGAFYSSIRSTACLYELSVCVVGKSVAVDAALDG